MQATIHNEFLTLTVDTHGAEAVSLKNAAGQEVLWQADRRLEAPRPILFPWTGKLTGGAFTHKGKTYPGGQPRLCPGRGAHPALRRGRHHPAGAALG